jgi:hypothetical protein
LTSGVYEAWVVYDARRLLGLRDDVRSNTVRFVVKDQ